MPNIKLTLEYNGSKFHGWQRHEGVRTIQAELRRTIEIALRKSIPDPIASGRTDAGVHARAQVVNFKTDTVPDLERLRQAVSSIMRGELAVLSAEVVPDEFHARFSAKGKLYRYTIVNRVVPAVLDRGRAWFVAAELNIPKMQESASMLLGRHDFSCFQASGCSSKDPIKIITRSELSLHGSYLYYDVEANGFLKQMVRNIVGTLVQIGRSETRFMNLAELIESKDRKLAGPTAPAHGLCLERVFY